jgi:nucleotide-binding universal stress UspA family protein
MKNILVPTDFSDASTNAVEYAAALAQDFQAKLILLNVVAPRVVIEDISATAYLITEAELSENNKKLMKNEIIRLSEKYHILVEAYLRKGLPTEVIEEFSASKRADIVVMGMKGKGKSNSKFGSTTTMLIRKSDIPVLVIPKKAKFEPIRQITFASEFVMSHADYGVLDEFAEKYDSSINVLNVQKNRQLVEVENAIGKTEADLSFAKFNHRFESYESDKLEKGIEEYLKLNPSNMLAMVAHKHSFLKRTFGTIHTKNMCYQTLIPLLVFPAKQSVN